MGPATISVTETQMKRSKTLLENEASLAWSRSLLVLLAGVFTKHY